MRAREPNGLPLTSEEVQQLPAGVAICVVWSGGNGPHVYTTERDKWGKVRARCLLPVLHDGMAILHDLDFIGPRPPFTVVRRVTDG